jgi:hypothetical protein
VAQREGLREKQAKPDLGDEEAEQDPAQSEDGAGRE